MERTEKSFWQDAWWVGLYSLVLFGFAAFSGRPLTMHEARLPETSREMLAHHQWLLPTSGGRPWLERPPLPHWLVMSAMRLFGRSDRVWIVRLPSALMGTATVLLTLYTARKWFSPSVGITSALLLATSYKFYQYACLAEDDIYLAMLVSLAAAFFTRAELAEDEIQSLSWWSFFTVRSPAIFGFFFVLGLTNWTKGPLLGILILGCPVGVYLCLRSYLERSIQPLLRYSWLWGWLTLIALTLAWPLWAYHRYPDVVENWRYDYIGRFNGAYTAINQPWWYYPPMLLAGLAPWTPICLAGIYFAFSRIGNNRDQRAKQWILCLAIVPVVVLSIPKGKHDHYLVPFLAPWAMLGGLGLVELANRFNLIGAFRRIRSVSTVVMILLLSGYCFGMAFIAAKTDHTIADTAFLKRCESKVPLEVPLYIDGKLGPQGNLDFFRIQFYSRSDAVLLHNLTFLRSTEMTSPVVYVIARQMDERLLAQLGSVERIDQSEKSHDLETPAGRFTLFRLTFKPGLMRYPPVNHISSLQAMERAPGPWCGPPLE